MKLILYSTDPEQRNAPAAILYPAQGFLDSLPASMSEERKLIHVADKDLTTGTPYEIVDTNRLPEGFDTVESLQHAVYVWDETTHLISRDLPEAFQRQYGLIP